MHQHYTLISHTVVEVDQPTLAERLTVVMQQFSSVVLPTEREGGTERERERERGLLLFIPSLSTPLPTFLPDEPRYQSLSLYPPLFTNPITPDNIFLLPHIIQSLPTPLPWSIAPRAGVYCIQDPLVPEKVHHTCVYVCGIAQQVITIISVTIL